MVRTNGFRHSIGLLMRILFQCPSLTIQEKCDLADEELKRAGEIGLKNGKSDSRLTVKKIKKQK